MSKYINLDELNHILDELCAGGCCCCRYDENGYCMIPYKVPVLEIIRCGECIHMMPDGHCRQFADDRIRPSVSDFCSAGERRYDGSD